MPEDVRIVVDSLTPYRLTIIAAFIVTILSATLVFILGGPTNAAPFLTFVGSVAIPALLALFKLEQNAQVSSNIHAESTQLHLTNLDAVHETNNKLDALASALQDKGIEIK